ncbi:MAG: iron-containing alcohol dehydrogenase [Spirochaetota bacterium]|nr:MAG: iron-containing alcohol dehydrogenase [Spirochaetota bacterium]
MKFFEFTIPTTIQFGIDSVVRLGYWVNRLGDRVIIVTESTLTQAGTVSTIDNILKGKGIETIQYDAIFPNADSEIIDEIALIARKSKANVVIGIGGSRACNIAKIVSFLCKNDGEVSDYIHGKDGNGRRVPFIEIPTTFREVYALTSSAFLTDSADQANKVLSATGMGTDILMVDPVLFSDLPIKNAVYTALEILSLSIEGYISLKVNPLVEPVLLRGVEIVYNNLPGYIKNPLDVTVREKLCTAGLFTSIANIITGFGISFALSMGMNGKNRISKSITSSILLPLMMEYNSSVAAARFTKIAKVMDKEIEGVAETDAALYAVEAVRDFKNKLEIDLVGKISELGLEKDDLAEAAEVAIRFEDINSIPRRASFENLMDLLEKAF